MAFTISGLGSGLDVDAIVNQLVGIERLGQQRLQASQTDLGRARVAWSGLRTQLTGLSALATAMTTPLEVERTKATSSAPSLVSVSSTSAAAPTSLTVRVNRLATAQTLASGGMSSADALVGAGELDLGTGSQATGITVAGGSGARAVTVTAASTGAVSTGTGAAPTTFGNNTRTLSVSLDGGPATTFQLSKNYNNQQALLSDVQGKLPAGVTASLTPGGALSFTRTAEGASRSVTVTGSAAASLGFDGSTVAGTDGKVRVGSGEEVSLGAGASHTVDGVTVTAGNSLREGVVVATDATTTLTQLAAALTTASGSPVTATVLNAGGTDPYRLVLSNRETGAAARVQVRAAPPPGLPPLTEVQAGVDAEISYAGMTITRSTNSFDDLVAGTTLNLVSADPTKDVTIAVTQDDAAVTASLKGLVTGISDVLKAVNDGTKSTVGATTRAALAGTSARTIGAGLVSAVGSNADLGLKLERDGTYTLDEKALQESLTRDRAGTLQRIADLGTRLEAYAKAETATESTVARGLDAVASRDRELTTRIEAYDVRLKLVEDRYRRQFTAMDTAVAGLRSQSDWLAGQLGQLLGAQSS